MYSAWALPLWALGFRSEIRHANLTDGSAQDLVRTCSLLDARLSALSATLILWASILRARPLASDTLLSAIVLLGPTRHSQAKRDGRTHLLGPHPTGGTKVDACFPFLPLDRLWQRRRISLQSYRITLRRRALREICCSSRRLCTLMPKTALRYVLHASSVYCHCFHDICAALDLICAFHGSPPL